MKLNGIFGKGSGKVGSSVFAVSGGEQIVRQYNPNVSNPSTDAQVEQRSKFKLMSQIAADLAPVLAYSKKGLVSVRNQFVSRNLPLASFADNEAKVDYLGLKLTKGTSEFGLLDASFDSDLNVLCIAENVLSKGITSVVYILCRVQNGARIEVLESAVVTTPGSNSDFPHTFTNVSGSLCVYAYGIKNPNGKGSNSYGNYTIESAADVAKLVTSGNIAMADVVLTDTAAMEVID